ncbi:MAG: molybdate ABC transporter permease subunit [Bacteroidetes bacterium]|nr:molybdate ABC transporter permease subunit [Bacteroidota bacterium]
MSAADWSAVVLSLQVAAIATAISLPFGTVLAFVLAKKRFVGRFLVENLLQFPLVLPPVVTGYVLLIVLPHTIVFTWGAAVLASAVVGFPLLAQTARVAFEGVDPELEAAARVDGARPWDVFRRITLPLAARGVAAGAVLHFARALGEFGATIVVAGNIPGRTQTVPLALFSRLNQAGGEAPALRLALVAVGLAALSLVVYALLVHRLPKA